MRKNLVDAAVAYFKCPQWLEHMEAMREKEEEIYHIHIYTDTSIHPESLYKIMEGYYKAIDWPLDRVIDYICTKPKIMGLHGVHPIHGPHFDFFFRFNPDSILNPMPLDAKEVEDGKNLLIWGKSFQDKFMEQWRFKTVGPKEEKKIADYFLSKHWKDTLTFTADPEVTHPHGYVEINFDPKVLELYAIDYMKARGWLVDRAVPCVFAVGKEYRAKIVFLLAYPEKMFDIGWMYNPDVIIRPSEEYWCLGRHKGFDVWTMTQYHEEVAKNAFVTMTDEEIDAVLATFN
jgi:hypothetical protein